MTACGGGQDGSSHALVLITRRKQDAVDHVNDPVGRDDVGLDDPRFVHHHVAAGDVDVQRVSADGAFAELTFTTSAAITLPGTT